MNKSLLKKIRSLKFVKQSFEDKSGEFAISKPLPRSISNFMFEIDNDDAETKLKNAKKFKLYIHHIHKNSNVYTVNTIKCPKAVDTFEKAVTFANKYWKEKVAPKILNSILK